MLFPWHGQWPGPVQADSCQDADRKNYRWMQANAGAVPVCMVVRSHGRFSLIKRSRLRALMIWVPSQLNCMRTNPCTMQTVILRR